MSTQVTSRLDPSNVAMRLGMCAAALAGTAATVTDANAVVVTTFANTGITLPATTLGIYINFLTGATGTSAGAVAGYDFNPYLTTLTTPSSLGFYWGPTATRGAGVGATTTTGPYLDLPVGTTVSSASVFTSAIAGTATSAFLTTGTHVLGFKFYNETTSAFNYGYLTMTTTATTGYPARITGWVYENTGAALTVTAVPEAPSALMLSAGALALGAVNLRRLRRARRQALN